MGGRWELTMGAACPQWSCEREHGYSGTGSKWDGINYPAKGMGSDGTGESIRRWDGKQGGNGRTGGYYFSHIGRK